MKHYTIRASNASGPMSLLEPMAVGEAIHKVLELRDQGFKDIRLMCVETGEEVTDIEAFIRRHSL